MFETLRTAFKVLIATVSQDALIYAGLVFLLIMVAWSVLSLMLSPQRKFRLNCLEIIEYLRQNNVTAENYTEFTRMWVYMPVAMRHSWKNYELKKCGLPSEYFNACECYDLPFNGGLFKHNRAFMKAFIYFFVAIQSLISIAIIGTMTSAGSATATLTTTILTDALLVPFLTYFLLMVNYYIYTLLRHNEHKNASFAYYDMLDMINEKIDLAEVFAGDTKSVGLLSEIYENENLIKLKQKAQNKRRDWDELEEIKVGGNGLNPAKSGVLGVDKKTSNLKNNIIKTPVEAKTISPTITQNSDLEIDEKTFVIHNQEHFIKTIDRVEYLINKAKKEKVETKKIEIQKEINQLIKALTDFKQKAKARVVKENEKKGRV